jgi:hypothetical protein
MKTQLAALLLIAGMLSASCSPAGTGMNASIEISSAPPPPVIAFDADPGWRYLPDYGVYVLVDDSVGYDMFRVGGWFYVYDNGYWYRSHQVRGQFVVVNEQRVPPRIFTVSDRQHHWRRHPMAWHPSDHDHGNGHGHDDDHGRDHDNRR